MELDFSGFGSRGQETYYDKAVDRLISLMSERLLVLYKPPAEEQAFSIDKELRWVKQLRKVIKAIAFMEKAKTTTPKLGNSPIKNLSGHLKMIFVSLNCSDSLLRTGLRDQ